MMSGFDDGSSQDNTSNDSSKGHLLKKLLAVYTGGLLGGALGGTALGGSAGIGGLAKLNGAVGVLQGQSTIGDYIGNHTKMGQDINGISNSFGKQTTINRKSANEF